MFYRVNYNATTKQVAVESGSVSAPAAIGGSYVSWGTFQHDIAADHNDEPGGIGDGHTHVLWHHIRDLAYKATPSVQNMQALKIFIDRLRSFSIGSGTITLTVAAPTAQLTNTPTPANAPLTGITYVSSDPTKATVNAAGLVTRVANGTTVITATDSTGKTATRNVTVTA